MKRSIILTMALALMAWSAVAQTGTTAQSQSNAGASSNTSVSADKSGVNAQSDTSANASLNTNVQRSRNSKKTSGNDSANSSSASAAGDASLATGTTLQAVLTKPIDSRKAKEGDEVTAKTTGDLKAEGQRTIPKGTKLVGHVTKASAKANGDADSSLGVIFDRAEVAKGREVPIHAVIQALASTSTNSSMAMNDDQPMGGANPTPNVAQSSSAGGSSGGGGVVGGAVGAVGRTAANTGSAADNVTRGAVGSAAGTVDTVAGAGTAAGSTLNSTSRGVVGLPGYTLDTATASTTQGSIVTSSGKNVKLDSGTQMVLRVVGQ